MKRFGIHFRLLLAAVMLISITTFSLGYLWVNITRQFVQTRFEKRILFLARYLALNSELGILISERGMLNRLAKNLLSEKDVVRVTIFDEKNEILTDVSKEMIGSLSEIEVPVIIKESLMFPFANDINKKQQIIGNVKITYSTEDINNLLSIMKFRFLWLSLGMAALCIIIFYFFSRSLVAPVTSLANTARRVARGNIKLRVNPGNLPETRELALAFNAMLDSLEKSQADLKTVNEEMVRQKTLAQMGKFSLMIAHEVKNPLAIMKSSLDILKKDIEDSADNTMIIYIEDELKRLNRLIEDFLLFARPAVPNFRETDLNDMVRGTIQRFEIQLNGFPIVIEADIPALPCHISADPDLLMRAIGNILKNAVEANERQGNVSVKSFLRDKHWVLEIDDQGPGIDPVHIIKIFTPFFTTRSKGTGLGLAFTSQVITAHSGKLSAENRYPMGARFIMMLPLNQTKSSIKGNENI